MSGTIKNGSPDGNQGAATFFVAQKLLSDPNLAYFYTDLLINSPTTIKQAMARQNIVKSTAYKYANELAELGIAEELDQLEDGAALWQADSIAGTWETGDTELIVSPTVIAVYGAAKVDDDIKYFSERYGNERLLRAIDETLKYLNGNHTRRGVASSLQVSSAAGIAISQAIEAVIGVVSRYDPELTDFSEEIHQRTIVDAPYTISRD
ncbi:DUF7437 domain-containing protein [Haladaptatus sp. NG-SE-30]